MDLKRACPIVAAAVEIHIMVAAVFVHHFVEEYLCNMEIVVVRVVFHSSLKTGFAGFLDHAAAAVADVGDLHNTEAFFVQSDPVPAPAAVD